MFSLPVHTHVVWLRVCLYGEELSLLGGLPSKPTHPMRTLQTDSPHTKELFIHFFINTVEPAISNCQGKRKIVRNIRSSK